MITRWTSQYYNYRIILLCSQFNSSHSTNTICHMLLDESICSTFSTHLAVFSLRNAVILREKLTNEINAVKITTIRYTVYIF